MKAMTKNALMSLLAACLVTAAHAGPTVLLSDDFNSENGGVGAAEYSGFANFSAANIDLLAPGYFFNLCQLAGGSTPCLDMEGSGNGTLTTKTAYDLAPGDVTIQFDLAGDQRGHNNNVVTLFLFDIFGTTLYAEDFVLWSDDRFRTFTRTIGLDAAHSVRVEFLSSGPADSFGMLLDNVVLSAGAVTAPVPEPSTTALFGGGLAGLLAFARRRELRPSPGAPGSV